MSVPRVLLVASAGARFQGDFGAAGLTCASSQSAESSVASMRSTPFHFVVVPPRLPDMPAAQFALGVVQHFPDPLVLLCGSELDASLKPWVDSGRIVQVPPHTAGPAIADYILQRAGVARPPSPPDVNAPTRPSPDPIAVTAPAPIAPEPIAPEPIAPEPIAPEPIAPAPIAPELIAPEPIAPEPIAPEPIAPAPLAPEPVAAEDIEGLLIEPPAVAALPPDVDVPEVEAVEISYPSLPYPKPTAVPPPRTIPPMEVDASFLKPVTIEVEVGDMMSQEGTDADRLVDKPAVQDDIPARLAAAEWALQQEKQAHANLDRELFLARERATKAENDLAASQRETRDTGQVQRLTEAANNASSAHAAALERVVAMERVAERERGERAKAHVRAEEAVRETEQARRASEEHKANLLDAERRRNEAEALTADLEAQLTEHKRLLAEAQQAAGAAWTETERLTAKSKAELERVSTDGNSELARVTKQAKADEERLNTELTTARASIKDLTRELETTKRACTELNESLQLREAELLAARRAYDETRREYEELKDEAEIHQAELVATRQALEQAQQDAPHAPALEIERMQAHVDLIKQGRDSAMMSLTDANRRLMELEDEIERLRSKG